METLADLPLPPLRDDLSLSEASSGASGEPAWMILDPVVNRFYRIGWLEFECLLRWGASARAVAERVARETSLAVDARQVEALRRFLENHHLVRPGPDAVRRMAAASEGVQWLTWRWWLHHYLFFRIPLVRPAVPLRWLARQLGWLFTPWVALVLIVATLAGLVMVAHQWDTFRAAVADAFSAEGLLGFAGALVVGKTMHELGHAIVATRLGLRVAHMGVAFVVMWPMLYTDTSEAWKLPTARQRLAVASAGIVTEMALAGLATLGWALCEPGALRSGLLYLATTGWVLSLTLNASPFTRFDGYFILSDLLDMPNLHERSSALARTALRRGLLGLDEAWPEPFPPARRRFLIAFAWVTWVYRFALFLAIAVAVYLMVFKALGIVLFVVEVTWFIARPIASEVRYAWSQRHRVRRSRRRIAAGVALLAVIALVLPWNSHVPAYGVARTAHQLKVFAPFPARLSSVRPVGSVVQGDALVVLEQPDIGLRLASSEAGAAVLEAQLAGLMAAPDGAGERAPVLQRLGVQVDEAQAARAEIHRMTLTAPFAGRWLDVSPEWRSGQWVGTRLPLGVLVDTHHWEVDAYVRQDDVQRIREGAPALFFPDGEVSPIRGTVTAIATTRVSSLGQPMLSARYGGPLATSRENDKLVPTVPVFHVVVALERAPPGTREWRGRLRIEGERRSLLGEGVTRVAAAFLRESGF
ncbi:HlyD family efflux transporter periplasmic adaptor subunit [Luteibacter aegosomatissinici]|uniref:HlyD family efflux transporter periplasmic adaptor subunit n=1 Tax=Luteibacter aegosomatissinici TaxID=2911539 RepID=UPI001FFA1F9A|nr:HlyD family efflux transporter periplasmic adaptor subunit [Luteibacter aegosomatissinici]UPG95558.1 HlyD family efflux transporter periplasmic adaptor subunit [Luteibacter aegosomatissinici]